MIFQSHVKILFSNNDVMNLWLIHLFFYIKEIYLYSSKKEKGIVKEWI